MLFSGRGGAGKRWITRREAVSPLHLSQTHSPPQLTFSTLLLPLAAPNRLQAHSSSAEAQSVLGLPPPLGKSESIPTRASGPHTCSQAGADQNAPPAWTRAQQVPKCAHSLTHPLALINAELWKNGQIPVLTPGSLPCHRCVGTDSPGALLPLREAAPVPSKEEQRLFPGARRNGVLPLCQWSGGHPGGCYGQWCCCPPRLHLWRAPCSRELQTSW